MRVRRCLGIATCFAHSVRSINRVTEAKSRVKEVPNENLNENRAQRTAEPPIELTPFSTSTLASRIAPPALMNGAVNDNFRLGCGDGDCGLEAERSLVRPCLPFVGVVGGGLVVGLVIVDDSEWMRWCERGEGD